MALLFNELGLVNNFMIASKLVDHPFGLWLGFMSFAALPNSISPQGAAC
jgi:hypothetical protein